MTLLTGFFDGRTGIRLIDLDGTLLNEWRISYNDDLARFPRISVTSLTTGTRSCTAQCFCLTVTSSSRSSTAGWSGWITADGSSGSWRGGPTTFSSADHEGNLWVPSRMQRDEALEKYPAVPAPFQEEYVLKVSPDGTVLQEISILDLIYRSRYEGVLFANGAHDSTLDVPLGGDFMHLNDVEVLTPELASAFPMFEEGDLLLSLRNLNLLMVISPHTGQIKWAQTGPYLRQHDPDFLPTGQIAVYDNRRDGSGIKRFGDSRILTVDPGTHRVTTLYGARPGESFQTETRGEQQLLQNGNLLISESDRGHAFEVDPGGNVVWSYVNRWTDGTVGMLMQATRYPTGYLAQNLKEACHDR